MAEAKQPRSMRKPAELSLRRLAADADEDSRLTDSARKLYAKIIASYNWTLGYAECSDNFIVRDVDMSLRSVKYARALLLETERVEVIRKGGKRGLGVWSTQYDVPFRYRGADQFRELNHGRHAMDWLKTGITLPMDRPLRKVPKVQNPSSQSAKNEGSQSANFAPKPIPKGILDRTLSGGGPEGRHPGAGFDSEFTKWRIAHAAFVNAKGEPDEEGETLLAHLRNARGARFTLRCDVESDAYASLDAALGFDGDSDILIGKSVMMSTDRDSDKTFLRAEPLPWHDITILSGEASEDGAALLEVIFHDEGPEPQPWRLPPDDAARLVATCGGEDRTIGARVRWRIMPDDSLDFAVLVAAA
jgi:hypothetical protein